MGLTALELREKRDEILKEEGSIGYEQEIMLAQLEKLEYIALLLENI